MGPGLGTHSETQHFLNTVFTQSQAAMVIDADAINLLAAQPELLKKLLPNSILTPHPKEFERLIGRWKEDQEKLDGLEISFRIINSSVSLKEPIQPLHLPMETFGSTAVVIPEWPQQGVEMY